MLTPMRRAESSDNWLRNVSEKLKIDWHEIKLEDQTTNGARVKIRSEKQINKSAGVSSVVNSHRQSDTFESWSWFALQTEIITRFKLNLRQKSTRWEETERKKIIKFLWRINRQEKKGNSRRALFVKSKCLITCTERIFLSLVFLCFRFNEIRRVFWCLVPWETFQGCLSFDASREKPTEPFSVAIGRRARQSSSWQQRGGCRAMKN